MQEVVGIGARIISSGTGCVIVALNPLGGAAKSGKIFVGDLLVLVNSVPVYTEDDARQLLVGEVGTTVELTLTSPRLGEGAQFLVTVTRTSLQPPQAGTAIQQQQPQHYQQQQQQQQQQPQYYQQQQQQQHQQYYQQQQQQPQYYQQQYPRPQQQQQKVQYTSGGWDSNGGQVVAQTRPTQYVQQQIYDPRYDDAQYYRRRRGGGGWGAVGAFLLGALLF